MTRVRVVVTADDIERAGRGADGSHCPVALAVRRAGYPEAHVESENWRITRFDIEHRVPLSRRAIQWITRYDRDEPVGPATFYLEGPDA